MAVKNIYRAWRFDFPVGDEEKGGISISMTGGIEMVDEAQSIKQSIMMILSTIPGERVMRPTYGCDLFKLVFSPNDDTTAGLAIHYVKTALSVWEKRIDLLDVDAQADPDDPGQLNISLSYRVKSIGADEELTYAMNLSGKET